MSLSKPSRLRHVPQDGSGPFGTVRDCSGLGGMSQPKPSRLVPQDWSEPFGTVRDLVA